MLSENDCSLTAGCESGLAAGEGGGGEEGDGGGSLLLRPGLAAGGHGGAPAGTRGLNPPAAHCSALLYCRCDCGICSTAACWPNCWSLTSSGPWYSSVLCCIALYCTAAGHPRPGAGGRPRLESPGGAAQHRAAPPGGAHQPGLPVGRGRDAATGGARGGLLRCAVLTTLSGVQVKSDLEPASLACPVRHATLTQSLQQYNLSCLVS